eukprot:3264054-Pyramimonas_sp.AAC.1
MLEYLAAAVQQVVIRELLVAVFGPFLDAWREACDESADHIRVADKSSAMRFDANSVLLISAGDDECGSTIPLRSKVDRISWHDLAVGLVHRRPCTAREGVGHILHRRNVVVACPACS